MKVVTVNIKNLQVLIFIVSIFLCQSNAWACMKIDDSYSLPPFVIALLMSIVFALTIIGITYLVKRVFFKTTNVYSVGIFTIIFLSLGIGLFGSFILPLYQDIYIEMGVALPDHTSLILRLKHLFWFPFLISILLLRLVKSTKIKLSWVITFIGSEIVLLSMVIWSLYSVAFVLAGC